MSEDCKEVKGWRGRCLGKSVQAEGTAHSKSLRWGQRGGHLFSWGHSEEKAASRNEVGEVRGLAGTSCGVCSRLLLLRVKWEAGNGLEQGRNGIQVSFQPKRLSLHACSQRLPAAKPVWPPALPSRLRLPCPTGFSGPFVTWPILGASSVYPRGSAEAKGDRNSLPQQPRGPAPGASRTPPCSESAAGHLRWDCSGEGRRDMPFRGRAHWESAQHRCGGASPQPQASRL